MSTPIKELTNLQIERTRKALEERRFPTYVCDDVDCLKDMVASFIKPHEQVSVGGSMTLEETGIINMLKQMDVNFIEHDTTLPKDVQGERQRMAFSSDTYLCSANAISENGEIYNVDGNGNRVAATIFGPKQVLLIVSVKKIVRDLQEAEKRIGEIAAPANCLRLHKETPCVNVGHCMDCKSKDRICASYTVLRWQQIENRIKVIFIKESFGY